VKLAARLQHPHIVPLLAAGEAGGAPYYTMPFVRGESLRAHMSSGSAQPRLSEVVPILRQIAAALAYAHEEGVIHRDIKPENILISGGFALVADFGIAKAISAARAESDAAPHGGNLTQVGMSLGTPAYMAPEQALGDVVDQRADIYSWGIIAYEYVTGAHVFAGKTTSQQLVAAHIAEQPRPIGEARRDIPAPLGAVIMQAIEKNPRDRQQRAREIVAALEDPAVLGTTPTAMNTTTRAASGAPRKPFPLAKAGIVAAAVVAAALVLVVARGRMGSQSATVATTAAPINTIAVLPFANTGGDTEDQYFSDGMTDELARALSKMPRIQVASRTSSYAFRGKSVTAQQIGKALNVGGVVEGTVRRAGNRLRVTAQLTNASTGLVMWTDGFERPSANVFEVQDELTKAIVTALTPTLSGSAASAVASESRGTTNPLAYDLYLRGRFEWNTRTANNLKESVADFRRAIALDPTFARAYAGLASDYAVLPEYAGYAEYPLVASVEEVRLNAAKALAIDSTLAEPHTALALALESNWEWEESEREFKKAIALDPKYPTAHQWFGFVLADEGRIEESLAQVRIASKLDPLSSIIADNLCFREAWVGHLDLAARPCREARAQQHDGYAFYSLMRGAFDTAAVEWKANGKLYSSPGLVVYSLVRGGRRAEGEALLPALEKNVRDDPLSLAIAYFGMNEPDKAFPLLERALDLKEDGIRTYAGPLSSPVYESFRSDARFAHVVERMGLTKYAKSALARSR
jgi:TolB-like protein/tetratricopeptide (TPR) repeat protein